MGPQEELIENLTYDELRPQQRAQMQRTLTMDDINAFALVSGDMNPAHVDAAYAEGTRFHGVIAHGMFAGALISSLLGTECEATRGHGIWEEAGKGGASREMWRRIRGLAVLGGPRGRWVDDAGHWGLATRNGASDDLEAGIRARTLLPGENSPRGRFEGREALSIRG